MTSKSFWKSLWCASIKIIKGVERQRMSLLRFSHTNKNFRQARANSKTKQTVGIMLWEQSLDWTAACLLTSGLCSRNTNSGSDAAWGPVRGWKCCLFSWSTCLQNISACSLRLHSHTTFVKSRPATWFFHSSQRHDTGKWVYLYVVFKCYVWVKWRLINKKL